MHHKVGRKAENLSNMIKTGSSGENSQILESKKIESQLNN